MSCAPRWFARFLALFFVVGIFGSALTEDLAAQSRSRRIALVVGNSAYQSNPLKNPVNDATDIAQALKAADFDVALVKDADLASLERAVDDFAAKLNDADTGLFYYAGHGVQVDGVNFLIPVSPRIDDAATARVKSLAVDTVVAKMEQSGVRTTLLFLDSCRDNPFPGANRGGTRGLAIVPSPKTVNSLIAYATSPGDTAQDGTGRNGVFSGAVLTYLQQPGLELAAMMKSVKADVAQATANKQNPRVDDGMKEDFFFVNPDRVAQMSKAASDKVTQELVRLEQQLAERQKQIAASKDSAQRQRLELEQQRQQALQAAKKMEAEHLKAIADKQAKAAEAARKIALQKAANEQSAKQKQNDLNTLAASRRTELEKLATNASSDVPDILIGTVERLEKVLADVDLQYAQALGKSQSASKATWDKLINALEAQEPDITENDAEFGERIKAEKQGLENQRQAELVRLEQEMESQRISQTDSIRTQYNETMNTLKTKVWTLSGSSVVLTPGVFDRNARTWPFTVTCTDPTLPIQAQTLIADLSKAPDPKQAIRSLDTAVKANALAAELDWGISERAENGRYTRGLRTVRIRNLSTNEVIASIAPNQRLDWISTLTVGTTADSGPGIVRVNGVKAGSTPWTGTFQEGQVMVEVEWNQYSATRQLVTFEYGKTHILSLQKRELKVGDIGPAGGFVFYDKGSESDGWRYLEAAPADIGEGQWYNGKRMDIKTVPKLGNGKANTASVVRFQGTGQYAAALCNDYVVNGFDDWFLPSKEELNEMYLKLKKNGIGSFVSEKYWSSSQYADNNVWYQLFDDGNQYYDDQHYTYRIRPVRAF